MALVLIMLKDPPPGIKKYTGFKKWDIVEIREENIGLGAAEKYPTFLICRLPGPAALWKHLQDENKRGKIFLTRRKHFLNIRKIGLETITNIFSLPKMRILDLNEKDVSKKWYN
jgi:hypothetical protein